MSAPKENIPARIMDIFFGYVQSSIRFLRIVFYGDEVEVSFFNFASAECLKPVPAWNRFKILMLSFGAALRQLRKTHSKSLREEIILIPDSTPFQVSGDYAKYDIGGVFKNGLSMEHNSRGKFEIPPPLSNIESISFFLGRQRLSSGRGHVKIKVSQGETTHTVLEKKVHSLENHWDLYRPKLVPLLSDKLPATLEYEVDCTGSRVCVSSPIISRRRDGRTVLILILDAVRPGDLGVNNPIITDTPEIDKFFGHGISYQNSFSQGNWTLPSFASMAISQYASSHNIVDSNLYSQPMTRDAQTMAEIMRENGFFTYGSFSHVRCNYALGHHRGFEHFYSDQTVQAKVGTAGVKGSLDLYLQLQELKNYLRNFEGHPFFGVVHLSDTHYPYFHNPGEINDHHLLCPESVNHYVFESKLGKQKLHPDGRSFLEEAYKRKLKEVDMELGEVFRLLNKRSDVTVILVSDHGYSFLNPTAHDLSDEMIRTPFLITSSEFKLSGNGERVVESSVDLLPTLSTLCRLKDRSERSGHSIFSSEGIETEKSCGISEVIYDDTYELKWIDFTRSSIIFCGKRDRKSGSIDLRSLNLSKIECTDVSGDLLCERAIKGLASLKIEPHLQESLIEVLHRRKAGSNIGQHETECRAMGG